VALAQPLTTEEGGLRRQSIVKSKGTGRWLTSRVNRQLKLSYAALSRIPPNSIRRGHSQQVQW
jgi:hypothetical protein